MPTREELEKELLQLHLDRQRARFVEEAQTDTLTDFMKHLYEAGFDVQVILSKGFDFAVRTLPGMDIGTAWSQAARQVQEAARALSIDREAQFKAYAEARDDMRYRMRAQP